MTIPGFKNYLESYASKVIPYNADLLKNGGFIDPDGHIILCHDDNTLDELAREYCLGTIPPESLTILINAAHESYDREKAEREGKDTNKENIKGDTTKKPILTPEQRIDAMARESGSKLPVDSILVLSEWIESFGIAEDTFSSFLICIMGFDMVSLDNSAARVQTISEFYHLRFREYLSRDSIRPENIVVIQAMDESNGFSYIDFSKFGGCRINGIRAEEAEARSGIDPRSRRRSRV